MLKTPRYKSYDRVALFSVKRETLVKRKESAISDESRLIFISSCWLLCFSVLTVLNLESDVRYRNKNGRNINGRASQRISINRRRCARNCKSVKCSQAGGVT